MKEEQPCALSVINSLVRKALPRNKARVDGLANYSRPPVIRVPSTRSSPGTVPRLRGRIGIFSLVAGPSRSDRLNCFRRCALNGRRCGGGTTTALSRQIQRTFADR